MRYIFGSFLSATFYEQIEIEKKEEEKKLFCLQNQFEFLKRERKKITKSCDGNSNCGFFWGLFSSLHRFYIIIVLKRKREVFRKTSSWQKIKFIWNLMMMKKLVWRSIKR